MGVRGVKDGQIVFFFQAEDGIRDDLVTGVQTCALPICRAGRCVAPHLLPVAGDRQGARSCEAPERRAAYLAERSDCLAGSAPGGPRRVKSCEVKFWAIRPGKARSRRTYEVRPRHGHKPHSRTRSTKAQAESFLSELRQAARSGQAFDTDTGLPGSMLPTSQVRSWPAFCLAYVDMKWPSAAPKTRDSLTDALAAIIPAVVAEELPDWLDIAQLRGAPRHYALAPVSRVLDRPPEPAMALRWLEKNSLPVSEVGKPAIACSVLDAITLRQDGRIAG